MSEYNIQSHSGRLGADGMKMQVELDLMPKKTFKECVTRVLMVAGRLKYIAAELDMSPAELSRKLAG